MIGQGDMKTQRIVSVMMLDMGVPAHLKGFRYLRTAIVMSYNDMNMVGSVTKLLYPEIAKQYNTTDSKVERAIRNAIEISWQRGNRDTFDALFGYHSQISRIRPTNSEYIAALADAVGIKMNDK